MKTQKRRKKPSSKAWERQYARAIDEGLNQVMAAWQLINTHEGLGSVRMDLLEVCMTLMIEAMYRESLLSCDALKQSIKMLEEIEGEI